MKLIYLPVSVTGLRKISTVNDPVRRNAAKMALMLAELYSKAEIGGAVIVTAMRDGVITPAECLSIQRLQPHQHIFE
jgi:hypothetical protein